MSQHGILSKVSQNKPKRSGLAKVVYDHLVQPFAESSAPISHISRGAAIGMFVAMTPTVGIQMYIVGAIWILLRSLIRFHFNLPIAVALVWISNPVTVVPIYYVFLLTGNIMLGLDLSQSMDFSEFQQLFVQARQDPAVDMSEALLSSLMLMFWRFGWPMAVGSLVWAAPLAILAYPFTTIAMLKYRGLIARREGLTYAEWKKAHVRVD